MWRFKNIREDNGEELSISGTPGAESVADEGPDAGMTLGELLAHYGENLLGARNFSRFGRNFPLVIKYDGNTVCIRHTDEGCETYVADITPTGVDKFQIQDLEGLEKGLLPRSYSVIPDIPVNIINSQAFTTNILCIDTEVMRDYSEKDTFVIIVALKGSATFHSEGRSMEIKAGETALISALATGLIIDPEGEFMALEAYL